MPHRGIKDTIRTSKTVNSMTDFQFRLWVYLITYVDDYGRGSADPEILKGYVFPRLKRVRESDIDKTLAELADLGAIHLYTVGEESLLCFPNWGEHQRIRSKEPKFPGPDGHDASLYESAASGGELPQSAASGGELRPNKNKNKRQESAHLRSLFAEFWDAYPRKVGKDKAQESFENIKPDESLLKTMIDAVIAAKETRQWTDDGVRYIPYPATWLNQGRWKDECPAQESQPPGYREDY